MAYSAKVLADSLSPGGVRLTTLEVTFPRIVLAEFNTHRMFSRNSASSRAIPVEKRIRSVINDPFIPEAFGQNQKGMQANTQLTGLANRAARLVWIAALYAAVAMAWCMAKLKVHKQLANRLLEPFLWHTVIVTATEWSNFFALRCHPDAQPEIRKIAEMMRDVMDGSDPFQFPDDDCEHWHMPLCAFPSEKLAAGLSAIEVSIGRCARVSYLTHDGRRDPIADIELKRKLAAAGHMSPLEHVARPMTKEDAQNIVLKQMNSCRSEPPDVSPENVFCGNLRGWVQYRKTVTNEDDFSKSLLSKR